MMKQSKFALIVALAFSTPSVYAGPGGEIGGHQIERGSIETGRPVILSASTIAGSASLNSSVQSIAEVGARVDEVSSEKVSFFRQTMEALSLGQSYIPLGGFGLSATAERTSVFPPDAGTKTKSDEISFIQALGLGARYVPQGGWGWSSTKEDGRIVPEAKPATSSLSSRIAAKASNALRQLKEMAQMAGRGTMYSGLGGTLEPGRVIASRDEISTP